MFASGSFFLQISVFLFEIRIFKVRQELRDFLTHGWRRKSPVTGLFRSSSAMVAEIWPSNKKLVIEYRADCTQVRSCTAGDSNNPTRRAIRNTMTHAKPCQLIHRTPKIREIAVAAAHAEGRTVIKTITRTVTAPTAANLAVVSALTAANKEALVNPDAACPLHN